MANELPPLRRVITGFDASDQSVFLEDEPAHFEVRSGNPGSRMARVWATGPVPVPIDDPDRSPEARGTLPPSGGSVLNILDIPPEPTGPVEREQALAEMRNNVRKAGLQPQAGLRRSPDGAHPRMHETDTIDYAFVLSGEVYAVMDKGEKLLKAGDVLIQRGNNHAWSNRSGSNCRMAFVLIDAKRR